MKRLKFFFALLLGSFLFLYACQKEEKTAPKNEQVISVQDAADDFTSDEEVVEHYLKVIEEQKKIGSSVVFQDGEELVENPDRAWLEQHFNAEKGGCGNYCYWFEYRAWVTTASAGYRAFDASLGTFLWSQGVVHPAGGWQDSVIYISNAIGSGVPEHCIMGPPPCINILWTVVPVSGTSTCDFFRVRVRRPCGGTQAVLDSGSPIPPPSGSWSIGPFCPLTDPCPCPIEPCPPLPDVFVCCTPWGFCLCDGNGNQLSQSPGFLNTAILWSAPSQYAGYTGECLSFDHKPGPLPKEGEHLVFTIQRGECFYNYDLIYDCE